MTKVGELKAIKCLEYVEWTLRVVYGSCESEAFYFKDCYCYLRLSSGSGVFWLQLRSNKKIQPSVKVTVFGAIGTQPPSIETHSITDTDQVIWRCAAFLSTEKMSFRIIFHNNHLEDEKSHVSTECQVPEKVLMSSDIVHLQALARDFSKLQNDSSSCDVKITCDGETLNAHRNVLEVRSTVLSAMLNSDMVEGKSGLIKVEGVEASIFEIFLNYLYTGKVPELNVENAVKFYEVADKYAVQELKEACSEFLTDNLSERNACEMLILADQHSDDDLRKNVISFMIEQKIPENDSCWLDFSKRYLALAVEVLNIYVRRTRAK